MLVELPYLSDDTRLLTEAALEGVERVYREGFRYSKAEVLLLDLSQRGEITIDLFSASQPVASEKIMGVLDSVNARWGSGTMCLASVPVESLRGHAQGNDEPEFHHQDGRALDCLLQVINSAALP